MRAARESTADAPLPIGCLVRDRAVPELGHGRVVGHTARGQTEVRFDGQELARALLLTDHPELGRLRLYPGQPVRVDGEASSGQGRITEIPTFDRAGLWTYGAQVAGEARTVSEADLHPVPPPPRDPLARWLAQAWDPPATFAARHAFLRCMSRWQENAMGTPPFLGARIHPLPHQIHAARRVLTDRAPRYVLADEVGLGKTIEAGLVVQALQSARPGLRVLVLAPGAMSRQWLCELFLRFGDQVFVHVDATRLAATDPETLLAARRLIVSTSALESDPRFAKRLVETPWDLVILDEAHQIPPSHGVYACLRELARKSAGFLALSATPTQRNEEGLLGLLALVSPDLHDPADPSRLQAQLKGHRDLAAKVRQTVALLDGEGGPPGARERAAAKIWRDTLLDDDEARDRVASLAAGDADAGDALTAYVQEYYALDRRIIRTRRADVTAAGTQLCQRRVEVVRYRAPQSERAVVEHVEALARGAELLPLQRGLRGLYHRAACTTPLLLLARLEARRRALASPSPARGPALDLLAALERAPGPAEGEHLRRRALEETPPLPGEAAWLEEAVGLVHRWLLDAPRGCARFAATQRRIQAVLRQGPTAKVLVFAEEREEVIAFAEELREALGVDAVGALHHAVDEAQVAELALRFQQPGRCRVLVSDDLGGDGRNFQIASAIVHLDQSWSVSRLEQRIGRLDRMGRDPKRDVLSLVVAGPSRSEDALRRLHQDAFGVYERSLGGLEFLVPQLQRALLHAACDGADALAALHPRFCARVDEERALQAEEAEETRRATRRQLEEAREQAEILAETDGADDVPAVSGWAAVLGMQIRGAGEQLYLWRWTWEHLRRCPPGLYPHGPAPDEGRVTKRGTFSRYRALGDESLELFAPGHPLVDALARDLQDSSDGRAAAFTLPLGAERRGQLFLHALVRSELPPGSETRSAGLLHRAHARLWMQARSVWIRLAPGSAEPAAVVREPLLLRLLRRQTEDAPEAVDPDALGRWLEPQTLQEAVRVGAAAAVRAFRKERAPEIEDAVRALEEDLRPDLRYFEGVMRRDEGAGQRAAKDEVEARRALLDAVRDERAVLDALALVIAR